MRRLLFFIIFFWCSLALPQTISLPQLNPATGPLVGTDIFLCREGVDTVDNKCTIDQIQAAVIDPLTVFGPAAPCADNVLLRTDGATATQLQCSAIILDDTTGDLTAPGPFAIATTTDSIVVNPGGTGNVAIHGPLSGQPASTATTGAGVAFTNQPTNDGIEILSDGADTRTVTLIGTTNGTDTIVVEDVVLNGVTFVPSIKTDWGVLLAAKLSVTDGVRTVTIRKATGNGPITTIIPAALSSGVETVSLTIGSRLVVFSASGASTKQLGIGGTNPVGAVQYDSQTLTGTTNALSNSTFETVTEIYTGDLEATRTATVASPMAGALNTTSIAGNATGAGTLLLDGDPSVAGSVTVSAAGVVTAASLATATTSVSYGMSASNGNFTYTENISIPTANSYVNFGGVANDTYYGKLISIAADATKTYTLPNATGTVQLSTLTQLTPTATPPVACAAGTEGTLYQDADTHKLCYCNATGWVLASDDTTGCS